MKKNISINLQGLIFHIEEDGYEVLSRYLAEVKAHFASYQGHEDIVADIEGRIAELFAARLSPVQQVISLADVDTMIAKMGRVRDFAVEFDEDDAAADPDISADTNAAGGAFGPGGPFGPEGPLGKPAAPAAEGEPRRLYRDMAHRKIGGVAAGIAQYFSINPLWVRIAWVLLALFTPALVNIFGGRFGDDHINLQLGSWAVVGYIIMWIVLPKRYDAPAPVDTPLADGPLAGRKYYRDVDNGQVGGVAAGLAHYLNIDVTLVRIVLLAGLFAGGFTFMLYLILWIVAPQAKTVADKMRMRGDVMTLEGFDSQLRNAPFDEAAPVGGNRQMGTFLENLGRNLRPLVSFVGSSIRVGVGLLLTAMGFGFLVALAIGLSAGVGLLPSSQNIVLGDAPAHVMLNGIPTWGLLAGFLALAIPALSLLLSGLSLLFRHSIMSRAVSLSLLGLWLLSLVGVAMAVAQQSREYQHDAQVEQLERYPRLTTPVLLLDARSVDRQWEQRVDLNLAATDSGRVVEVLRTLSANGSDEEAARRNAITGIDYTIRASGDSSLVLDDHFSFLPDARYRRQQLAVTLRLPRDRTFRISRNFAYDVLDEEDFARNRRPEDPEQHRYRLRGNKLECLSCTDEDMGVEEEGDSSGADIDLSDGSSDEGDNSDSRSGSTLNYGGAPAFDTDLNSYGGDRRSFTEEGFTRVSVAGGYRVVVRRADSFRIEAAGEQSALKDLQVELDGGELQITPRTSNSFFKGNWGRNQSKVLITISLPAIERLELAGAVHADLGGFERQDELRVEQAGASHLRLNGDYGTLRLEQAGACRTTATGRADVLNLDAAGACELAAGSLQTRAAVVDMAGICKARLHVSESLRGDAVGASVIAYSGKPGSVQVESTGPSSLTRIK